MNKQIVPPKNKHNTNQKCSFIDFDDSLANRHPIKKDKDCSKRIGLFREYINAYEIVRIKK